MLGGRAGNATPSLKTMEGNTAEGNYASPEIFRSSKDNSDDLGLTLSPRLQSSSIQSTGLVEDTRDDRELPYHGGHGIKEKVFAVALDAEQKKQDVSLGDGDSAEHEKAEGLCRGRSGGERVCLESRGDHMFRTESSFDTTNQVFGSASKEKKSTVESLPTVLNVNHGSPRSILREDHKVGNSGCSIEEAPGLLLSPLLPGGTFAELALSGTIHEEVPYQKISSAHPNESIKDPGHRQDVDSHLRLSPGSEITQMPVEERVLYSTTEDHTSVAIAPAIGPAQKLLSLLRGIEPSERGKPSSSFDLNNNPKLSINRPDTDCQVGLSLRLEIDQKHTEYRSPYSYPSSSDITHNHESVATTNTTIRSSPNLVKEHESSRREASTKPVSCEAHPSSTETVMVGNDLKYLNGWDPLHCTQHHRPISDFTALTRDPSAYGFSAVSNNRQLYGYPPNNQSTPAPMAPVRPSDSANDREIKDLTDKNKIMEKKIEGLAKKHKDLLKYNDRLKTTLVESTLMVKDTGKTRIQMLQEQVAGHQHINAALFQRINALEQRALNAEARLVELMKTESRTSSSSTSNDYYTSGDAAVQSTEYTTADVRAPHDGSSTLSTSTRTSTSVIIDLSSPEPPELPPWEKKRKLGMSYEWMGDSDPLAKKPRPTPYSRHDAEQATSAARAAILAEDDQVRQPVVDVPEKAKVGKRSAKSKKELLRKESAAAKRGGKEIVAVAEAEVRRAADVEESKRRTEAERLNQESLGADLRKALEERAEQERIDAELDEELFGSDHDIVEDEPLNHVNQLDKAKYTEDSRDEKAIVEGNQDDNENVGEADCDYDTEYESQSGIEADNASIVVAIPSELIGTEATGSATGGEELGSAPPAELSSPGSFESLMSVIEDARMYESESEESEEE